MGGYTNKRPSGYLECDYTQPWPGLVTSVPSSQAPPGALTSCFAMSVRGRLTPQPAIFHLTGAGGMSVTMPNLAAGENVCATANVPLRGSQQGFTVLITNVGVYLDYVVPTSVGTVKAFTKVFTFPTAYPRYARFGAIVIGNTLYFSSASQLGVYAVRPAYSVASVEMVTQPSFSYGGTPPTVVFSDGGGTGATGTVTVTTGKYSVAVNTGGANYISPPLVSFNGGASSFPLVSLGAPPAAVAILSAYPASYLVQEISASTGVANLSFSIATGSNYSNPQVLFIGGGGTGASATAILSQDGLGTILGYAMDSFGQNYTSTPTVQIVDPTGSGATVPTANLFLGLPFVGGDFMASIAGRLVLGNIIGGDGNNTTSVEFPELLLDGAGYTSQTSVLVEGGGGEGAQIYPTVTGNGQIIAANMGELINFTGTITSGQPTITNCSSVTGIQKGMSLSDLGFGIPGGTTVSSVTPVNNITQSGNFTNGSTSITGVGSTTGMFPGQPIYGVLVPNGTVIISASGGTIVMSAGALNDGTGASFIVTVGNTITMSANATASTSETITATGYVNGNQGSGYYAQPYTSVVGTSTLTGIVVPILYPQPQRASSQTLYPDRLAWSAPNAYGYFDPNWGTAPGGYNTLAEAGGIITGLSVIESVLFVGHNGGETETTPNQGSAEIPFAFYPLWNSPTGVIVRYGSMAQFGTTTCFLSNDNAYMLNPSGLTPIGNNIANLLEDCSTWNDGNFPLQGLYGSIVVIEGQLHYLIALSADDWDYQNGNGARQTQVFDYNLSENNWHQWTYQGATLTCPITQSFDVAQYTPDATANNMQLARDTWLLMPFTQSTGNNAPYGEIAVAYEAAPLTQELVLLSAPISATPVFSEFLNVSFRTETPSPARMQSERRILIEYENLPAAKTLGISPTLTLTYTGQQDPSPVTGTVSQQQISQTTLSYPGTNTSSAQILTQQADFGTFTGACTNLQVNSTSGQSLVSIVRVTQVADLPKTTVP